MGNPCAYHLHGLVLLGLTCTLQPCCIFYCTPSPAAPCCPTLLRCTVVIAPLQLIMNIECETPDACSRAGYALYSPTTQTRLTDNLARSSISLLPGTFQVYGVNSFNRYRGNETLWENKALTMQPPSAAAGAAGINYTDVIARSTVPVATATNGSAASGGLLGNFTIPGFTLVRCGCN